MEKSSSLTHSFSLKCHSFSDKLSTAHSTLEFERIVKAEDVLLAGKELHEKTLRLINSGTQKLEHSRNIVNEVLLNRGTVLEQGNSTVGKLEKAVKLNFVQEKEAKCQLNSKIEKLLDEKFYSVKVDVSKEKKVREEFEDTKMNELTEEIYQLEDRVSHEGNLRKELYRTVIDSMKRTFNSAYRELRTEKNDRGRAFAKLTEQINEGGLRRTIYREQQQRSTFEGKIIGILENACKQLEFQKYTCN